MNEKTFRPENKYTLTYDGKEIFSSDKRVEVAEFLQSYNPPLSDRELFLKVMLGEWEPNILCKSYFAVDSAGLIINCIDRTVFPFCKMQSMIFAPTKELAETLSQVITGRYRPTSEDCREKILFWKYDNTKAGLDEDATPCYCEYGVSYISYFFTATQRDNHARQQGEKREPDDGRFFIMDENLYFGNIENSKSATSELNRMRTELNRLSQRFPKE